jgi:hypothetical protein
LNGQGKFPASQVDFLIGDISCSYVYPRGMMLAVGLVFLSSFLPVLIGTGASPDPYTEWHDGTHVLMPFRLPCSDVDSISGYFTHLATEIVGPWLGYLFMFGAAVTNIGIKQYFMQCAY